MKQVCLFMFAFVSTHQEIAVVIGTETRSIHYRFNVISDGAAKHDSALNQRYFSNVGISTFISIGFAI